MEYSYFCELCGIEYIGNEQNYCINDKIEDDDEDYSFFTIDFLI